jgi:hypothetical protein
MAEKKTPCQRRGHELDASNSLDNKVLCGDCASLVETTDINASRRWNAKGLCTEDCYQEEV